MSMLIAIDNGFQSCLMAPTEILANQHFKTLTRMTEGLGISVSGCLPARHQAAKRKQLHAQLQTGEMNILIGTHALIEDPVLFKNLGLVIIDEQHRFGVAQRARMWSKSDNPPHILVMTATPIPRTLAMTLYGDLDISVLMSCPREGNRSKRPSTPMQPASDLWFLKEERSKKAGRSMSSIP